jgi:SAM-dependent methyltransferase
MIRSSDENELSPMIPPSPWVMAYCARIAPAGRVLDLACGSGRHARLLAEMGHSVLAVDRNEVALGSLRGQSGIEVMAADLEGDVWPLAGLLFAGIVVTNYLWRPRLADLLALLAPQGVLIYETFMLGNAAYGKPSRPEFLLQPGELRALAQAVGLREIAFEEGYCDSPKPAMRQAICAMRD